MAGLYLHIPFCKQACYYCDFHFTTNQLYKQELIRAMATEIRMQGAYLGNEAIHTVYFGGGTPSLLTMPEFELLLHSIRSHFNVSSPEITVEANPDDLSIEKLHVLKQLGINRLSIGIQSFDDDVLRYLNRSHNVQAATNCVENARRTGFSNITLDLIYGIPIQSDSLWEKNIGQALALQPEHISAYALTIEDKTVFGRWAARGRIEKVDEEMAARQFELLMDRLSNSGYEHYEISNFCKPGFHSQHNSNYWFQKPYLGIGPSAHSYNGLSRQYNIANNYEYVRKITAGIIPCEIEILTREDNINEYLMTSLRTKWGCNTERLKNEFQFDILDVHKDHIRTLLANDFVFLEHPFLLLTRKGKLLADKISADFFVLNE